MEVPGSALSLRDVNVRLNGSDACLHPFYKRLVSQRNLASQMIPGTGGPCPFGHKVRLALPGLHDLMAELRQ